MRIVLLTDFGTRDSYVSAMKGVIASRTDARVDDLTHEIEPFDVFGAAWYLRSVARYWPEGTIFVCVVDPGVGTSRRILAVSSLGRIFLAPDNGLLTFVWNEAARVAYSVEDTSLFLPHGSNTFHGRDRFAPVAAAIANGADVARLGPAIDRIVLLAYEPPVYGGSAVRGTIVAMDRFGNAITDIERERIRFGRFAARVNGVTIERVEQTYGYAAPGPFLIVGSTGCLEISIANDSAAERLALKRLDTVELLPRPV